MRLSWGSGEGGGADDKQRKDPLLSFGFFLPPRVPLLESVVSCWL